MAKAKMKRPNGRFLRHEACVVEGCGSSDGMAVYQMPDGTYSTTCFSCDTPILNYDPVERKAIPLKHARGSKRASSKPVEEEKEVSYMSGFKGLTLEDMEEFPSEAVKDRGLKKSTMLHYGVKVGTDETGKQNCRFIPVYKLGQITAYRVRSKYEKHDKIVEKKPELLGVMKKFSVIGDAKGDIEMFGQSAFPEKSKSKYESRLVLTEGEEDAMSAFQMLQMKTKNGKGYPVLSVPSGANVKAIKANLEYIASYDVIYLNFDNDEAGKKLTEEACKVLPANKVRIMQLPKQYKDANDMIKAKSPSQQREAAEEYWSALWNSKEYSPVGVIKLADCWDAFKKRGTEDVISFPNSLGKLNLMMNGGMAKGEITFVAAPTSVGKSSFLMETLHHVGFNLERRCAGIFLESDRGESLEKMMTIDLSKNISQILPDDRDWKELRESFERISSNENIYLVDHQGSMDSDDILAKIEFLAKGADCEMIMLDPLQLALAGATNEEMEDFMSELLKITKRCQVAMVVVSHIRKSSSGTKDVSEGGRVTESMLKGSSAIIQVAFNTIILERDKVNENPVIRNTTEMTIWKCRRTGNTGSAGHYYYRHETGRIEFIDPLTSEMYSEDYNGMDEDLGLEFDENYMD